ncbi:hypothetical protein ACLKA7_015884 [Drosophila subpalustris]
MATRSEQLQSSEDVFKYPLRNMSQGAGNLSPRDPNNNEEAEREQRYRDRASKYSAVCWHLSLVMLVTTIVIALMWTVYLSFDYYNCTPEQRFANMRRDFAVKERRRRLGGKLKLSPLEELANDRLLAIKKIDEDMHSIWNEYQLRSHYLKNYKINETDLYGVLRNMPKGGLLHVHDLGLYRTDLLINHTYQPDLWACIAVNGVFEDFRFSRRRPMVEPQAQGDYKCQWTLMDDIRAHEKSLIEHKLRKSLTIDGHIFKNSTHLANHLRRAHRLIQGLVSYRPFFPSFLMAMLEDFYSDGVNYVELRSSLPILYDLDDTNYTIWDTAYAFLVTTNIFRSSHEDFIGLKLIYAPERDNDDAKLRSYISNARFLKAQFTNFVVGFDLVNFGDECQQMPLGNAVQLLHASKELDFYFHAGESRCRGNTPNANLIDALLLGSKRIGNPINLPQHPEVIRATKILKIAAEVCPLSNYYLQSVNDFGQHPAASLIAAGHPIVVGSDYPSFWNAAPLTDDFYVTFVGIANGQANLRLLKQLAINSFQFSAMTEDEKHKALFQWQCNWNNWVETFMGQS